MTVCKTMLLQYAVLACYMSSALSGIATTPGIQRKALGDDPATFQWLVTGLFSNYTFHNQTLGFPGQLNTNAIYTLDSQNGVVILVLNNIQLSDAGNYSLSVTVETTTQTDAGALLFVYGYPTISVNQTSGGSSQLPATEGDTVELTCIAISTSLPAAYRLTMYYQWYVSGIGQLQNISSGPAKLVNFDESVPGYSIKDDGKTLLIVSAQGRDTQGIYCYAREQWSPYNNAYYMYVLALKYKPYVTLRIPDSRKSSAIVGYSISLRFFFQAYPTASSVNGWTFVNTHGSIQDLPGSNTRSDSNSPFSLGFIFLSEAYYGNYSITLGNTIGSITETFQVIRPRPPEAPSSVKAQFLSHYLIVIAWNCMWSSDYQQTTFLLLKALYNDSVVDSLNTLVLNICYNSTFTTQFLNGIEPGSDYEVLVWSVNNNGSSDIVKLRVTTPKIFKFYVSSKTISLSGDQATVNFSATEDKIARLYVTCCLELTGYCNSYNYYNRSSTAGQAKCDNIPSGDVYVFDFVVYGGIYPTIGTYYLTMEKGVRVSRNGETEDENPTTTIPYDTTINVINLCNFNQSASHNPWNSLFYTAIVLEIAVLL